MTFPLRLAIVGAAGRMGRALLENAAEDATLAVTAAIVSPEAGDVGRMLGPQGIVASPCLDEVIDDVDVIIDFSSPSNCLSVAQLAAAHGKPFVSGTTGLDEEALDALFAQASAIPVLHAANFSVGVNVLERLVELASRATASGWDMEVFEAHHRRKVDAPSGTALLLGDAAARGRQQALRDAANFARHGQTGPRTDEEIGFQVLRGGDIVGEHTVYLCANGERLELTHRATDRGIFARGALRAARWIAGRPAGRYTMHDVLFAP
jgi:4-hydroxy-tetrahydrodipicolinate reductase